MQIVSSQNNKMSEFHGTVPWNLSHGSPLGVRTNHRLASDPTR